MFHLFERFGLEIEYMIVDRDTLETVPICDKVIEQACGSIQNEIERGTINWSNELVLHVIELKTALPARTINGLSRHFYENVKEINSLLQKHNAMLLPGPMHPFMDPITDMHLWPYENSPIYAAFDRIFSCKGHGWSNLQSMHINLPFSDDGEFAKLHTAIRLLLPIIPALSAASPIADGVYSGFQDYRMEVYRTNSKKIPLITGNVIPQLVVSKREYEEHILNAIYKELEPYDSDGVLQEEWVNARGAIARFDRNTIEIRIIDTQECPDADMAIAAAITGVLNLLTDQIVCRYKTQQAVSTESLVTLFRRVIREGEQALVDDFQYLQTIGMDSKVCRAKDIWKYLLGVLDKENVGYLDPYRAVLEYILCNGTLATRILRKTGDHPAHTSIVNVYRELAGCLAHNEML